LDEILPRLKNFPCCRACKGSLPPENLLTHPWQGVSPDLKNNHLDLQNQMRNTIRETKGSLNEPLRSKENRMFPALTKNTEESPQKISINNANAMMQKIGKKSEIADK